MTPTAETDFEEIGLKDLSGGGPEDPEEIVYIVYEMAKRRHGKGLKVYRVANPAAIQVQAPAFPTLLARSASIEMTRAEFVTEVRLILEMKGEASFNEDTYLYSIRVVDPAPFKLTDPLEALLQMLPEDLGFATRTGYITHDVLYGLLPQEGRLITLLDVFANAASSLEVKLRRAPADQQTVVVRFKEEPRP